MAHKRRVIKMSYMKKIAVPKSDGTVEVVAVGDLEKKILEIVSTGERRAWKISEKLSWSAYYRNTVYQTIRNMKRKKLIQLYNNGQRAGLVLELTPLGAYVLEELKEIEQQKESKKEEERICAPYEVC